MTNLLRKIDRVDIIRYGHRDAHRGILGDPEILDRGIRLCRTAGPGFHGPDDARYDLQIFAPIRLVSGREGDHTVATASMSIQDLAALHEEIGRAIAETTAESASARQVTPAARYAHCDDVISDPETLDSVRAFLAHARSPAHGMLLPGPAPRLFASHLGRRVRVVMASRMGDVGITTRLDRDVGYEDRVWMGELTDLSDQP